MLKAPVVLASAGYAGLVSIRCFVLTLNKPVAFSACCSHPDRRDISDRLKPTIPLVMPHAIQHEALPVTSTSVLLHSPRAPWHRIQ